jgi:hypothetical protein
VKDDEPIETKLLLWFGPGYKIVGCSFEVKASQYITYWANKTKFVLHARENFSILDKKRFHPIRSSIGFKSALIIALEN